MPTAVGVGVGSPSLGVWIPFVGCADQVRDGRGSALHERESGFHAKVQWEGVWRHRNLGFSRCFYFFSSLLWAFLFVRLKLSSESGVGGGFWMDGKRGEG